jgi:8-oxo-dGTP pyrophosphatase MutT (NUDIX family)
MEVVYTGEEMPYKLTKSIFLAGPSPRPGQDIESWRKDAIQILRDKGFDGVVFCPENRNFTFKDKDFNYDDQVEWEDKYLNVADCILFWVPRDLSIDDKGNMKLPALTTNIEWGTWADTGKVVFGAPEDAEKVTYLKHYAEKYNIPTGDSILETIEQAMELIGDGAERFLGERFVPLFIWKTDSFQKWYRAQLDAGNRLEDARLLFNFRPRFKDFVFLWVLKANIYVASEDRYKDNEIVIARPDISSVCLWYDSMGDDSIFDKSIILVREFRTPAATEDGFILELPGGSAPGESDPEKVAAEEVQEETGFYIEPKRLKRHEARQLAGTFSSHKAHLFSAELDEKELEWFISQDGIVHGNVEDSERTFIEVHSVQNLIDNELVDWSTLGMILSVIAS